MRLKDSPIALNSTEAKIESASNEIIKKRKVSMLSAPNKVLAYVPDLSSSTEELIALGLEHEEDGWHVKNREWFPNAIGADSIIIDYGERKDGTRDIGFCSQEEFSHIYADSEKYSDGKIEYIDPTTLELGEIVEATKCATGEFVILPVGTEVSTPEGEVIVAPGQVLIVNEAKNSIFVTEIEELLKRYVADPLNPASQEAFAQMQGYLDARELLVGEAKESSGELHAELEDAFCQIDRNQKVYEEYVEEKTERDLKNDYEKARLLVKSLSNELLPRLDALSFDEKLVQARELLREIFTDENLSVDQRNSKVAYVLVSLLPKTNNHQHLKGSVPMDVLLGLAEGHGFDEQQIEDIKKAYEEGEAGFEDLDDFNRAYGIIGNAVRTPEDYQTAVRGIIFEAVKSGQLTTEIRCSVIGQRGADGKKLDPEVATENLLAAMDAACYELKSMGIEPPKVGLTLLGYRGRDWHPEEVTEHARIAVDFAKKYPKRKFSFDIAGPEDTGYSPSYFKEAYDIIRQYNDEVATGKIKGERVGVTTHAGETPTYDGDPNKNGSGSVLEALALGADRIGHGVQAITNPEAMVVLEKSGATVEICGVCNVLSIPINTRGLAVHPVQELVARGIPVTICTDNDSICGTKIIDEYAQFLFTGHGELMNWNTVKEIARNGIKSAFISEKEKKAALEVFEFRIRKIERTLSETRQLSPGALATKSVVRV